MHMSNTRKKILLIAFILYALYFGITFYPALLEFASLFSQSLDNWFMVHWKNDEWRYNYVMNSLTTFSTTFYTFFLLALTYFAASFIADIIENKFYFRLWTLEGISLILIFFICYCAESACWQVECANTLTEWLWYHIQFYW